MAKNLKLNIKNTQLAEALKLSKIKKAPPIAKKNEEPPAAAVPKELPASPSTEPSISKKLASKQPLQEKVSPAEEAPLPLSPTPKEIEKATPPSSITEKKAAPEKTEEREIAPEREPREPLPPARNTTQNYQPQTDRYPHHTSAPRRDFSQPPQGAPRRPYESGQQQQQRPPYTPRPARPPYSGSGSGAGQQRPPYTGNSGAQRPPYTGTGRAPFTPGSRPPYPSSRPPYSSQRPFIPRTPQRTETPRDLPKKATPEIKKPGPTKEYRDLKPQKKTGISESKSFDSRDKSGLRDTDEGWRKKRPSFRPQFIQEEVVIRPKNLKIRLPITVKDLAAEMKLKAAELVSKLFMQGTIITLNDYLTDETAIQLLGHDFDCEITIDTSKEERLRITDKSIKDEVGAADPASLITRPPVVAFMGHVDHGKTSLIDAIRKSNVASGEAGAITQHIGAFKCHTAVGDITILDTPGHEAFSAMRSRGADVTDIIVLVVAGDEGIRAQTIEAIEQARSANVPIVVAINKCDKPNFNAENIYRQLSDQNLLPEAWGGTTITINCSALTGIGIKELLEMLALQAEVLELKANPDTRARGAVIESEMHKGLGAVATLLIQNGTLHLNDALVFAQHWARVKTMQDETGGNLEIAGPATPVKITGLSGLPLAGSDFIVVKSEREARSLAEERSQGQKNISLLQKKNIAFENLLQQEASKGATKQLNLIIRADVQGSLEALKNSLNKISSTKASLLIISEAVGEITESDIQLASASHATILGFHTKIESHAESLIKQLKINVRLHDIIYHAVDDIREIMRGLLEKIPQETDKGEAIVKAVFKSSQLGSIAGCQVTDGVIRRTDHIRLIREGKMIWKGNIATLKRVKEDVREVSKGIECGILLQNYNEIQEGDLLQAFEITYLEQSL